MDQKSKPLPEALWGGGSTPALVTGEKEEKEEAKEEG